jgi:hypothetical protein
MINGLAANNFDFVVCSIASLTPEAIDSKMLVYIFAKIVEKYRLAIFSKVIPLVSYPLPLMPPCDYEVLDWLF